ncbi:MAG: hypothetical protein ABWY19_15210 [Marmoricola sp.]
MSDPTPHPTPGPRPGLPGYTIKTYRYLRLAMVTMLVLLAAGVLIERVNNPADCFQPSISDYYYTPAQAVFVGALVTIGVCMIVLKGSTEWEDILLNLGGMLAPVVAFVPTPAGATCSSVPNVVPDIAANVDNNIAALFVAGVVGVATVAGLAWQARARAASNWNATHTVGMLVALVVLLGGFGWFHWGRESFIGNAHYAAALPLFIAIILVAVINARQFTQERTGAMAARDVTRSRYFVVAALLVVLPVLEWAVSKVVDTNHLVLWVEVTVLVLFAVFWLLQTEELWSEGVRNNPSQDG